MRVRDLTARDHKQRALIAQWRQAALEATTADAAVTYTECADALDLALAVRVLIAVCEGCGTELPMPTTNARKAYPDLPVGWSQSGVSRHRLAGHGVRLAAWCQACQRERAEGR